MWHICATEGKQSFFLQLTLTHFFTIWGWLLLLCEGLTNYTWLIRHTQCILLLPLPPESFHMGAQGVLCAGPMRCFFFDVLVGTKWPYGIVPSVQPFFISPLFLSRDSPPDSCWVASAITGTAEVVIEAMNFPIFESVKLFCIAIGCTEAVRSFSCLGWIYTWPRTTITTERLADNACYRNAWVIMYGSEGYNNLYHQDHNLTNNMNYDWFVAGGGGGRGLCYEVASYTIL